MVARIGFERVRRLTAMGTPVMVTTELAAARGRCAYWRSHPRKDARCSGEGDPIIDIVGRDTNYCTDIGDDVKIIIIAILSTRRGQEA